MVLTNSPITPPPSFEHCSAAPREAAIGCFLDLFEWRDFWMYCSSSKCRILVSLLRVYLTWGQRSGTGKTFKETVEAARGMASLRLWNVVSGCTAMWELAALVRLESWAGSSWKQEYAGPQFPFFLFFSFRFFSPFILETLRALRGVGSPTWWPWSVTLLLLLLLLLPPLVFAFPMLVVFGRRCCRSRCPW